MNMFISETLGAFVFFLIIKSKGDPVMIAVGLLIGILVAQLASPAHLNPAVTAMEWMKGNVNNNDALMLVAAQLAAAFLAVQYFDHMKIMNR